MSAAGASYYLADGVGASFGTHEACDAPVLEGSALNATRTVSSEREGRTRAIVYELDGSDYTGGALELCLGVGEILVEPATGSNVRVSFRIEGDQPRAVSETVVDAAFRATSGGGLTIAAWEERIGEGRELFGMDGAEVTLVVSVPASGGYRIDASNDVGDVRVRGLLADELRASADVGTVLVTDLDLQGDARVASDVGDAIAHFLSVQSGNITISSDVGNAEVQLPLRADVGYDAHAATNVGEVVILIGDTESYESEGDGPGEDERARSSGYSGKPTRVVVEVTSDVGDARITTENPPAEV